MKPLGYIAVACLLLAACQEPLVAPESAEAPTLIDMSASKNGGGIGSGPSANGASHVAVEGGGNGTFSFHVKENNTGTSKGSFQVHDRANDIVLKGNLNCLKIEGNRATASGFVTQVSVDNPYQITPGWLVIFGVEDNGEGKKAPPDRWTDVLLTPIGIHCSFTSIRDQWWTDAEAGSFQVRP